MDGPSIVTPPTGQTVHTQGSRSAGSPVPSNRPENFISNKKWSELDEKGKRRIVLDKGFSWAVRPFCIISTISSVLSCILANFFDNDSEYLEKTAEYSNRFAYFLNGLYGAIENFFNNCAPGTTGFGLVSLASVIGNKENMYLLKGWGTVLDQIPAANDDVARNPEILKQYNLQDEENNGFTAYTNFLDSIKKTWDGTKVVFSDIYKESKEKLLNGKFIDFLKIFITDKQRRSEKNLIVSSFGVLIGVSIAFFTGLRRIGASIRDIEGIHADLGLFGKKDLWYKACGGFYTIGSAMDLVYRWTNIPKLELAAVGVDNLGFLLMTWANKNKIKDDEKKNGNKNGNHTTQPPPEPALATAAG